MHETRILKNSVKADIVVFIHGFMGSPRQFDRLADVVYSKGYSAMSLLLPGHGGSLKEFSNATSAEWTDYVNAEIGLISKAYDRIFIVGHSMGCLLAINAYLKYSEYVHGLFLIYCPFKLDYLSHYAIKARLRQMFYKKTSKIKSAYRTGCSVPLMPSIIWRSIKPAAELKKLTSSTIDTLHNIFVPITAIYSSSDEVVSTDSLDVLNSGAKNSTVKSIMLADSLHAYFTENEQTVIENALIDAVQAHLLK
jgi:carboxylesterase